MTDPMTTPASTSPITDAEDRIAYGAVHLGVTDTPRALRFWRDAVGLVELPAGPDGSTRLGSGERTLLVLHEDAARPVERGRTGLYHVAIHVPDASELARAMLRLSARRIPQSPTDHLFSHATYANDPDGNMLELTLETIDRYGWIEATDSAVVLYGVDGRPHPGTAPLDVEAALAALGDADPEGPIGDGAFVGHVHLHVRDLTGAYAFYRDVLGFAPHAIMRPIGMADLGAGATFPHRIAMNDWHGPVAPAPAAGSAGLRRVELELRAETLDEVAARAEAAGLATAREGDALILADPAGNPLALRAAPSTLPSTP